MSEKELEIFELCERLAELLGDKEAIANLQILYERHPEMFANMQELRAVIEKVVSEPEIIVDANKNNEDYAVIKAAKRLNDEKMADVVIKNEGGTNEIFHTNKKRIKEFKRLKKKKNLLQVETPTPSTHQINGLELIDNYLSGANALSAIENDRAINGRDAHTPYTQAQSLDGRLVDNNISSNANDIIAKNKTNVSESAIARVKRRIEKFVQNKGAKDNAKSNQKSIDKGKGR